MVAVRKGITFRPPLFIAGCRRTKLGCSLGAQAAIDHKDDIFYFSRVKRRIREFCGPPGIAVSSRYFGEPPLKGNFQ
jgi:hypothetical protein